MLDAPTLAALIKSKADAKKADPSSPEGWFIDIIAEAIVEHITQMAEVTVVIVGLDNGAALSSLNTRFTDRGDSDTMTPDAALQIDGTPIPTTPPATSVILSKPGLIT